MALRVASNRSAQRARAPLVRSLRRIIQRSSEDLRRKFSVFLDDRGLLEEMAREARALNPKLGESGTKSIIVAGVKLQPTIPDDVRRIVERALSRASGQFSAFELELEAGFISEAIQAYEAANQGVIRQAGLRGTFNLRNPRILDAIASRANQLGGAISETTFDAIKEVIAREFYLEGRGPIEVARALRNEFDFLSSKRSQSLARTETGVISEMGAFEQYAEIGVENKRWLSALVEQTRPGHRKAHGQTVPLFDPFLVENEDGVPEEMMHPLDPDASASNVVNCLCSSAPVIESVSREPWLGE